MSTLRYFTTVFAIFLIIAVVVIPAGAQQHRRRATAGSTLPANTYFRLRMNQEISSETARVGDKFTAEVQVPIYRGSKEVVPAGSIVSGRVTSVRRAEGKGKPGSFGVTFSGLKLPGRPTQLINGSLAELVDKNSGSIDEEGRLKGGSAQKRNIVFIGGGAAGGALIGSILGGGKGGAIGAAVGGGAGIIGSLLKKGNEAKVTRVTEVGMVLNRAAVITR
jgi:hypothetical protein